ncbi:MAG: hypothetical protein IPF99_29280 [Deltaproteobacteria bacterium]|nr:hypothetical protein [Deltaproteobacteria bacterium]
MAGVEYVDDVGVADGSCDLRLADEALHRSGGPLLAGMEDLERDAAAGDEVLGLVDGAHPALTEEADESVAGGDDGVRHRQHRSRASFE